MYQSDSFFITNQNRADVLSCMVTSVFKILADSDYHHCCNEDERMHYFPDTLVFIRCTDGRGKIYLNKGSLILNKNDYVFLRFYDIKEYKSLSGIWGYRWVNFVAENIGSEIEFNKIYSAPFSENEDTAFQKLLSNGKINLNNQGYITSLFLSYFYSVTLENKPISNSEIKDLGVKTVDEICAYIHQMVYSKVTIDETADFFKISPRRLHQIFKSELGISPKQYILKKKMEEGYRLIVQTSTPINKIAYLLCFSSPYHFSNDFKKTFGQSPSSLRKTEQQSSYKYKL